MKPWNIAPIALRLPNIRLFSESLPLTMTTQTKEIIEHIGKLARLALTEEETIRYANDIGKILAYVDQLKELNLPTEPQIDTNAMNETVFREDVVVETISMDQKLKNAPLQEDNYFRVPQIMA